MGVIACGASRTGPQAPAAGSDFALVEGNDCRAFAADGRTMDDTILRAEATDPPFLIEGDLAEWSYPPSAGDRFVLVDDDGWLGIVEATGTKEDDRPCSEMMSCPGRRSARWIEHVPRPARGQLSAIGPTLVRHPHIRRLVPKPQPPSSDDVIVLVQEEARVLTERWEVVVAWDLDGDETRILEVRARACPSERISVERRVRTVAGTQVLARDVRRMQPRDE
jgi:hypothetical protein